MKKSLSMAILLVAFASAITAQENIGTLKGKIIDQLSKQPLPGASVRVVGTSLGAVTNLEGYYAINSLPENIYKLQIDFLGYQTHFETDVRVVRGKTVFVREIAMIDQPIEGEEVTIEASGFEQDKQAPISNYNYTREEIRRAPGATGDIFRAIETLPGVSSSGGEFSSFSVRGGSPRDNIVLVDNIPFSKVSHFDGGTEEQEAQGGRFSIFTPGLIETANFQAGGFSARYGGKNASLVDLKIKEGNKETPTANGTYDVLGWEANYDGPSYIYKNTSLMMSARHQDFKTILDLTGQKDLGHPRYTDVIVKTTTDVNPWHKISFLGIFADDEFDRTLAHVFESDKLYGNDLARGGETKYLLGFNWRWLTNTKSFLENSFYFSNRNNPFHQGRAFTDPVAGNPPMRSSVQTRENIYNQSVKESQIGFKSNFTYQVANNLSSTSGIEVNQFNLDYAFTQIGFDTTFIFDRNDYRSDPSKNYLVRNPANTNSAINTTRHSYSGFTELSYTLDKYVTFNPGVRYEYSTFNKKGYVAPRISVSYIIDPKTTINGAAGTYYQSPALEIIGSDPANENLKSEKAFHFIAGATRYFGSDLKLTVETYYKQLNDLIVKSDRTSDVRTNQGDGWARGVDMSLVKRFTSKWYGQVNYSRMASKRNDHDGQGSYNSDFSQPNIFNILLGYEFNKEWSLSTKWKYATGRPKDSYILHSNVLSDPNHFRYSKEITRDNGDRLDAFHTWNVRADYRKQIGRFAIVAFVDILNMYGHLNVNEEFFQYQDGKIDKRGFKIAPTMGVKLEM